MEELKSLHDLVLTGRHVGPVVYVDMRMLYKLVTTFIK